MNQTLDGVKLTYHSDMIKVHEPATYGIYYSPIENERYWLC